MEQQKPEGPPKPEFDIPAPDRRLPKDELELLIPKPEGPHEDTFVETRENFIERAAAIAVKTRTRRQSTPIRTPPKKGA